MPVPPKVLTESATEIMDKKCKKGPFLSQLIQVAFSKFTFGGIFAWHFFAIEFPPEQPFITRREASGQRMMMMHLKSE